MTSTLRTLLDRVEKEEGDLNVDAAMALIEGALKWANWCAGEGICAVEGQDPDELLMAYSRATGEEDWETLHERLPALLRAKIAQEGEEAYWSAPKDEDRCTAMAAAYRAMRAAAKADAPDPHVLQDRLHGMLRMAVASEDSFNRLSPAGRRLIQAAEGFFASSREDRDDLNACWDALQAETKRADAAEARLAALLRAKIAQEERT